MFGLNLGVGAYAHVGNALHDTHTPSPDFVSFTSECSWKAMERGTMQLVCSLRAVAPLMKLREKLIFI